MFVSLYVDLIISILVFLVTCQWPVSALSYNKFTYSLDFIKSQPHFWRTLERTHRRTVRRTVRSSVRPSVRRTVRRTSENRGLSGSPSDSQSA